MRTAAFTAIGFLAGVLVAVALLFDWPGTVTQAPKPATRIVEGAPMRVVAPVAPEAAIPLVAAPGDAIADLLGRRLEVPVHGISRETLRASFNEPRGASRLHEAIDILAPLGTPVVAVEDGVIAKLFLSEAGGKTIYLFDPSKSFAYYYAHLDAYADHIVDGMAITRGQVLGTVGVSGNAPPGTPHLHFAITKLTGTRSWWLGTPIDPYLVLK